MNHLPQNVWLERCANRIIEVDRDIAADEARRLARELQAFERTGVMAPEAAVDFVASELARPRPGRFERRASPRH
ncbi:hypothetical protein [Piscinibacter sp. XHJ-5]|uniref:hypothetical protein n=1 Tax=Piscinibacter sp. XHJ-5 TaxID=3037797 RepID=UPI002452DA6B|nr:hypothetical protein [Piscinibacter sp. XHJ-5]